MHAAQDIGAPPVRPPRRRQCARLECLGYRAARRRTHHQAAAARARTCRGTTARQGRLVRPAYSALQGSRARPCPLPRRPASWVTTARWARPTRHSSCAPRARMALLRGSRRPRAPVLAPRGTTARPGLLTARQCHARGALCTARRLQSPQVFTVTWGSCVSITTASAT
jgi:hypothetical protein